MKNNEIFISAGDLSGDVHASSLVKEIKNIDRLCHVSAVGGNNLKSVVDDFFEDIVSINAFGIATIKQIVSFRKVLKRLKIYFVKKQPDKIILVDFYGFHIYVARLAKKLKIPVYYYISPQVWASRKGRIKKLARVVKKMIVIFEFEERLYKHNGVEAVFVGNPLIDKVPEKQNFEEHGFSISNPPVIGLFPGSRRIIIERHMPIILGIAKILKEKINARFVMFSVDKKNNSDLPEYIDLDTSGDFERRKCVDFSICTSGTVSLENALMGIPMIVIYKLSYCNYFLIKSIIKIKYITMVNILSDKNIIPEFIQFNAKPHKIAPLVLELLNAENYLPKVKELLTFRNMLGAAGVSKRVAEIILKD